MHSLPLFFRLIVAAVRASKRRIQLWGCRSWPIADGQIFLADVRVADVGGWLCELTYSYSAMGEYYSGTLQRQFPWQKRANAFAERFPSKTRVPVRYDPDRPAVSTVLMGDIGVLLAGL
jgi:hypothetical protein